MARGRDRHSAKKAALAALGKDLARRARSRCEVCSDSTSLQPVALGDVEPDLENALLLCDRCEDLLVRGRHGEPDTLRFLEEAVWAELAPAQVAAIKMLENLIASDVARWPAEAAENLWVDEAIRARVDALP